ncbi:uncharacterized protein FIBRA_02756 [Fibroporia radiculosa]|uniref:NADP-dependent oxidoreductase domain-containing protein n=1 Tax=Fibroporia radiculosa TaxID=599839 RepID=J4I984_9APHY|nr:uncharacterized protein FIBRA_02756 [Fibroporia radiculosa]CCM00716.1 predicted protein [Fibroporia radiculosa]
MASLTITLNDGNKIPWLGFGTGTAFFGKDAEDATRMAIEHDLLHLDGAQLYKNEESLGAAIAASGKPRSSFYITTKLEKISLGRTVRDMLVTSLEKLRLGFVDLFLIHFPIEHEQPLSAIWKQFEDVQKEGLTRSIGVSNFRIQDFEAILDKANVIPAVNQIEYHPYVFNANQSVMKYMKEKNILPASYGGLSPVIRFRGGTLDPVLISVAGRVSKTAGQTVTEGQVLQLWLKAKQIPVITTTSKAERVQEYLAAEALPDLTLEEVSAIDEAGTKVHHRYFAKYWDNEGSAL